MYNPWSEFVEIVVIKSYVLFGLIIDRSNSNFISVGI